MVEKKAYESPNVLILLQIQDVITTSAPGPVEKGSTLSFDGYVDGWQ